MVKPQPETDFTAVYYFFGRHMLIPPPTGKTDKKISGYHYRCYRAGETVPFFWSHNYRKGHAGNLFLTQDAEQPDLILKLRPSFPLTGKIDVLDARDRSLKGVVTRGRKMYDHTEALIGKFVDTRTWKEHLGESVIDAVGGIIFGNGDAPANSDGANSFVLMLDKTPGGALHREQLPFFPDPPRRTKPRPSAKVFKKILPKNIGSALFDITPPAGWKLIVAGQSPIKDSIVLLCGALMTIEISRW